MTDTFSEVRNRSITDIKQFIRANLGDRDINVQDGGWSLLHLAAIHDGNVEVVRALVAMGANVNVKGNDGITPLLYAILVGSYEIAKVLVSLEADVNAKGNDGMSPLHAVVVPGNVELAKFLVSKGADVNAKSLVSPEGEFYTPLDFAKRKGDAAMVQYLSSIGTK